MTSRTLMVKQVLADIKPYSVSENNKKHFLLFETVDEAVSVYEKYRNENQHVRFIKYQLFIKSSNKLTLDTLKKKVEDTLGECNITYIRVDKNEHTGKVELDRFDDYLKLKALNEDIKFYHFDIQRSKNKGFKVNERASHRR
jgi:hypothetical protein